MIVVEWREQYRDEEGHTHYRTIQEEADTENAAEWRARAKQGRWFWMPDQPPTWPTKKDGDAA